MKKLIVSLFLAMAMLLVTGSPMAATRPVQKKSKPVLKRKTRSAKPRAAKSQSKVEEAAPDLPAPPDQTTDSEEGGINAEIIGPVYLTYTLPADQYFRLKVDRTISSETAHVNDRFRTTVVTPVYVSGVEVVPAGSIVEGVVTSAVPAKTRGRGGQIAIAFDTLILPDGTRRSIEGVLTELEDKEAGEVDAENEVSGRSSEKKKIAYIGGGGAGGAILGGAIGGAKGAAIGAIIGAGAGAAGVMLEKGNEAELKSGTEIGMISSTAIIFSIRSERLDRQ